MAKPNYTMRALAGPHDPDYSAAIELYTEHMPLELRTPTSEITYWMDNYSKQ